MLNISFPDQRVATVELSQNLRGCTARDVKHNTAAIVTPNGQQLVLHQARCLTGYETLLLQGIHYGPEQSRLAQFSDSLLQSLGGNAFQAHCCAVMFVVKEALLAKLQAAVHVEKQRQHVDRSCRGREPSKRLRSMDEFCEWSE